MKKYLIALMAFIGLCFSSCLKDKNIDDQKYGLAGLEDVKLAEIVNAPYKVISLIATDNDTTFTLVGVHLNSAQPAASDVTITLVLDQAALDQYNSDNGTAYEFPPASSYSVDNLTVTIPKGSRDGVVKMTAKPTNLSGGDYAFAFSIGSISDPNFILSRNYKSIVTVVGVKNRFDGNYKLRIKTVGWAAYDIADGLTGTWPSNADGTSIFMITSGSNSVKFFDNWGYGDYIQIAFTTGLAGATGFGATAPKFIFNLETNALTDVVNDAAPDPRNRAFRINPAVTDSRYDPDQKKIFAAYIMSQDGRPDQYIYDTLTYVSSR